MRSGLWPRGIFVRVWIIDKNRVCSLRQWRHPRERQMNGRSVSHANTTIILGTVTALTFATLTPALATGACSNYPSLDNCPVYGVYDNPTTHGAPYQMRGESYPAEHIRHAR